MKFNLKSFIYLILSAPTICITEINYAQEIKFTGYGSTGYIFYDRDILNGYNQETYFEGKLQTEIKINKKIEAQLDMRGNSVEEAIELREFSVKLEYFDNLKFKIGNIKRPFGSEYATNREDLYTVQRSNVQEQISQLGYGVRTVSLMGYYNYSKKRPDFPYTYAVSVFRDNNLTSGFTGRFLYHPGEFSYGINYMFQSKGGDVPVKTHGVALESLLDIEDYESSLQIFYLQNPEEIMLQKIIGNDETINSFGATFINAVEFDIHGSFIEAIQPVLLLSYYVPNFNKKENHVLQVLTGANFYLDKKVRIRFNADLRMTKNEFNEDYSTKNSRAIFEVQVKF
ncbi:MAG: hypothetical protein F9K45_04510 [Melioribacteraceae bacterium]|nr:MAG: hypothetical protein F9K45_04510 [Melioribacteraceae bacterium]